jgi:hypothetical protein
VNELVPVDDPDPEPPPLALPLANLYAPALEVVPLEWGLLPSWMQPDPLQPEPPLPAVLDRIGTELEEALAPAGPVRAAKYLLVLNEAFPQKDQSGREYGRFVAAELALCPADLLETVCRELVTTQVHRPAVAEVKLAVDRHCARRRRLLRHLAAARRYWEWRAKQAETRTEPVAQAVLAAEAGAVARQLRPPPSPRSSVDVGPMPQAERPRSRTDERLQKLIDAQRAKARGKPAAPPQP